MSLDVYLIESLDERATGDSFLWSSNITHNLNEMATAAGIYLELWRPDQIGIERAKELIKPLEQGLFLLTADPNYYKQFNASNGWGKYENFVKFVSEYLEKCREFPDSYVIVSR